MPKLYRGPVAALVIASCVLTACAVDDGASRSDDDPPVVLTTFTVLQDMVAEVGGEHVEVRSITPRGAEVHEYDPTPGDLRDAAEADLIMENGLGLEEWYGQFIDQTDADSATLTEGIETRPVTRVPGHPDDAEDMPMDPHAWTSPTAALTYVDNIEDALSELAPEHAEDFGENASRYRAQIGEVDEAAVQRVADHDGQIHLVTCEGAFGYFADDVGIEEHYLWPLNADGEGTPQQVEAQISYVEDHEVPVVFCETTVNDSAQQQVASATDAELGDPLYVDSLSEADGPVPTYLELLEHNVDLLLDAYEEHAS